MCIKLALLHLYLNSTLGRIHVLCVSSKLCGQKETKVTVKWYRCHIAEWGRGGGDIKSDEQMSNTTNRKALLHVSPLIRER